MKSSRKADAAPIRQVVVMDDHWHEGKPPFKGWWPASRSEDPHTWRFWDGKKWSDYGDDEMSPEEAGERAKTKAYKTDDPDRQIKWSWYWPKDARCQRVVPPGVVLVPEGKKAQLKVIK